MLVTLYNYNGKRNTINKTLQNGVNVDGTIKDATNVITPQIRFRTKQDLQNVSAFNYAYIAALNRYYFVENCEIISGDVFILSLRVDVLKSYQNAILASTATITERENAAADISTRAAIYDRKPIFQKLVFSENTPFNSDGVILMTTLKGKTV